MIDEQKQIEEMAKVMSENWFNETIVECATRLYNANYRKIPENAVVLTEERNKIICDRFEQLERVQAELQELNAEYYNEAKDLRRELKQARKEMAREILKKGNKYLMQSTDKACAFACFLGIIEHDYGVEVE